MEGLKIFSEYISDINISVYFQHTFLNESKYAMALAWAGENDGVSFSLIALPCTVQSLYSAMCGIHRKVIQL